MTWWDKLKEIAKREAGAAREEIGKAADALDEALAQKERELNASPAERVDMLLDEIAQEDEQFGELEAKLRAQGAERSARAGIEPPVPPPPPVLDLEPVKARITVEPVALTPGSDDRTSHRVTLDAGLADTVAIADIVNDLLAEVMVLDASVSGGGIALRSPTLDADAVADLVARIAITRAPELAPPSPADPTEPGDPDLDDPGDEGPEDLAHS